MRAIMTLNAGSSSVKFALFRIDADGLSLCASGEAEGIGETPGAAPRLHVRAGDTPERTTELSKGAHDAAIAAIVRWIDEAFTHVSVAVVGHRIVHGGLRYAAPALIDDALLVALKELIPLAPLHQPHNLAGVAAARAAFPKAPHVACFDTAFHRGHSFVNDAYALPRAHYDRGLRRFGFHGLSYEFIAGRLREIDPACAAGRVIVAHLGNGASLCAMQNGCSVATSMGFSALDGVPMGTRCGQIDPGLLLYLLRQEGLSPDALTHLLYHDCGLLGLSGVSSDMRALEAADTPETHEAIDYFTHRIRMEIASLAATMEGFEALVFTGGIGEHSVRVRREVVEKLGWLGLRLDAAANESSEGRISEAGSSKTVYVIPTNEELMIARHARRFIESM